jgi:hypothetical protein
MQADIGAGRSGIYTVDVDRLSIRCQLAMLLQAAWRHAPVSVRLRKSLASAVATASASMACA